ncbi:hypothetical protein ACU5B6_20160 [Moritella viscosa]|uniref:hypothetical protein n=1 Tax=Moritella viscosa TaxID=80854 RepID=UPI00406C3DC9
MTITEVWLKKHILKLSLGKIKKVVSLLELFRACGEDKCGVKPITKKFINELRIYVKKNNIKKQTPVIPTRIYSDLIRHLEVFIKNYYEHENSILGFLSDVLNNPFYARNKNSHGDIKKRLCGDTLFSKKVPEFKDAVEKHDLVDVFHKYKIDSTKSLGSFIFVIQNVVRILVHIYTGMRRNEVLSLKYNCCLEEVTPDGKVLRVIGDTTKLTGNRKVERWLICPDAINYIECCRRLTLCYANSIESSPENFPLFTSFGFLVSTKSESGVANFAGKSCLKVLNEYIEIEDCMKIQEQDIVELEKLDPFFGWRYDLKYKIGNAWPLATHQLRRSLAFYVAQSGLVSLPSLKRQLKHISKLMTLYYMRGSGLGDGLFSQKQHFKQELHRVKHLADAAAYINNILLSAEKLGGVHGRHIERRINDSDISILKNRDLIITKFKMGECSYKETPLGACMTVSACQKKALRAVSACISCDKAVLIPSKVDFVVEKYEAFVNKLEPLSLEYKYQKVQLDDLKRLQTEMKDI